MRSLLLTISTMPRQAATPESRSSARTRRRNRSGVTLWDYYRRIPYNSQRPTPKNVWELGVGAWKLVYDWPKFPLEPDVRSLPYELPLPAVPLHVLPVLGLLVPGVL